VIILYFANFLIQIWLVCYILLTKIIQLSHCFHPSDAITCMISPNNNFLYHEWSTCTLCHCNLQPIKIIWSEDLILSSTINSQCKSLKYSRDNSFVCSCRSDKTLIDFLNFGKVCIVRQCTPKRKGVKIKIISGWRL
jgi:hypothetical protein